MKREVKIYFISFLPNRYACNCYIDSIEIIIRVWVGFQMILSFLSTIFIFLNNWTIFSRNITALKYFSLFNLLKAISGCSEAIKLNHLYMCWKKKKKVLFVDKDHSLPLQLSLELHLPWLMTSVALETSILSKWERVNLGINFISILSWYFNDV